MFVCSYLWAHWFCFWNLFCEQFHIVHIWCFTHGPITRDFPSHRWCQPSLIGVAGLWNKDVFRPQYVTLTPHPPQAKRSPYSWPDAVGLRPRAFRLMMTSLTLALLAFLPLVVEGKVALVRMVTTSLLVVASLVTNLLVFAISAAWPRACNLKIAGKWSKKYEGCPKCAIMWNAPPSPPHHPHPVRMHPPPLGAATDAPIEEEGWCSDGLKLHLQSQM